MLPKRVFGFVFVITAVVGVIFSLVGLIELWRYRPVVTQTVADNLALFDQALGTTQDGLGVVAQVLKTVTVDVASLQTTTRALAVAIHDTNPMLDSLTTLTGKDFPASVAATQTSLASAQSSALLIDNALALLSSVPFSPVSPYKPAVPLHTSLAQVSKSMDSLSPSLATIHTSLVTGKTNLAVVETELTNISATTREISSSLASAQVVVEQYQTVTTSLKERVEGTQLAAPGWMTAITWGLSFVLIWFLISQLGLGLQGLELISRSQDAPGKDQAK